MHIEAIRKSLGLDGSIKLMARKVGGLIYVGSALSVLNWVWSLEDFSESSFRVNAVVLSSYIPYFRSTNFFQYAILLC